MNRILTVLIVAISIIGCTNSEDLDLLRRADLLTSEKPDSALFIMQSLDYDKIHGRADKAFYSLIYSQVLDKNGFDVDRDTLIMPAVRYYSRHDDAPRTAIAYYYYGRVLENAGDNDAAIKAFVDAKRYVADDDYYLKGLLGSAIGSIYYSQNSYSEATREYTDALNIFASLESEYNSQLMYAALGRVNVMLENFEKAIYNYRQALMIAQNRKDIKSIYAYNSDIAFILYINKRDASAALATLMHLFKTYFDDYIPIDSYPLLCSIYNALGDSQNEKKYSGLMLANINSYPITKRLGIYQQLSDI